MVVTKSIATSATKYSTEEGLCPKRVITEHQLLYGNILNVVLYGTLLLCVYTIGNGMKNHFGKQFSTKDPDQDNDNNPNNHCAQAFFGGWWYAACHTANLNGLYLGGATDQFARGVTWKPWKGQYFSLFKTEMKLRPTQACEYIYI